jgi:WD40 repeat protein
MKKEKPRGPPWPRLRTLAEFFASLVFIVILTACISVNEQQTPTAVLPTIAEPIPATTSVATASPTAVHKPTETIPTPIAGPTGVRIEPFATATMIRFGGWSLGGETFAYWTFDAEQNVDFSYPPGPLYFAKVYTGRICSYPYEAPYFSASGLLAWQPDDKVIVLSSDPPRKGTPCGEDFMAITDTTGLVPGAPDLSLSPGGDHRAITNILDDATFIAETSIVNVQTGKVENAVRWRYADSIGAPGLGGEWLTQDQFLIDKTLDQGPLLITAGKEIIQVAQELFGWSDDPKCGEDCNLIAKGMIIDGASAYHITLSGAGIVSNFPQIELYHAENGEAETLPFRHQGGFSPDGRWLILYDEVQDAQTGEGTFQIWLRPADPPGSEARLLTVTNVNPFLIPWSPDGTRIAVSSSRGISVFSMPGGVQVGFWETGEYETMPGVWSPSGEFLAVRGNVAQPDGQEALFIIRVP